MIYNYQKSNRDLLINNNFKIDVKLLDLDHSLQMIESGHITEPRYGAGDASSTTIKNPCSTGVYITPIGQTENPTIFQNNCLMIAIIYCYFHEQFQKNPITIEGRKYVRMKRKEKGSHLLVKSAGALLFKEFDKFHRHLWIKPEGPYSMSDITHILDIHNAQLHIFSLETRTKTSYPIEFSPERSQWYMEQTEVDSSEFLRHVNVIINFKQFSHRNNFHYCFGCDKSFRYTKATKI